MTVNAGNSMVVFFPIFLIMQRWAVSQQPEIQGISGCVVGNRLCLSSFIAVKIGMFIGWTVKIFLAIRLYSTEISSVECKKRTRFLRTQSSVDGALQCSLALLLVLLFAFASGVVSEKEVHIDRLIAPFIMFWVWNDAKLDAKVVNLFLVMFAHSVCSQSLDLVPPSALPAESLVDIGPNRVEFLVAVEAEILPSRADGS